MGCNVSSNKKQKVARPEVDFFLTTEEKQIARESWTVISLDLPATGLHIFTRLFEMENDMKKLFKRLMSQSESGHFVIDTARLERHATIVMKHLGMAVDSLEDSVKFSMTLNSLGEKHATYLVSPDMLPFLWPAVRDGLKMRLGDKFTVKTELAWKHIYDYITCKISEGIEIGRHNNRKIIHH
ncbi:unnamed protein product [Lymnaea stagnalis]|uniref:Globin n=1 Tax=Lymnaea stagnalis TaxID=6523 RepID=A0AAV2HKY8_LYMST